MAEQVATGQAETVTLRIRDALPADLGVLRDVFRESSLSNEGDRLNLLPNPDALEFSPDSVNEGRTRVAVVVDRRIVGFASTLTAGDVIELDDLFVVPAWMRKGIGRELVLDVIAIAQRSGAGRVEVTANQHAILFYEKAGFVFDRHVETRFGSAPRMHLEVMDAP